MQTTEEQKMCQLCGNTPKEVFQISGNGFVITFDKEAVNNDKTQLKLIEDELVISGLADELVEQIDTPPVQPEPKTVLVLEISI